MTWLRRAVAFGLLVVVVAALGVMVIATDIALYGNRDAGGRADAALVLGAAVLWDRPSPVLAERLRHALELYRSGRVERIVLTGGRSPEDELSEAEAGRRWLTTEGVPGAAIVLEDRSRTTIENFVLSEPILDVEGITTVLVVSDPIHMRRSMLIAARTGLAAEPSPTPTSRFVSLETQVPFLARETWFMTQYLVLGR